MNQAKTMARARGFFVWAATGLVAAVVLVSLLPRPAAPVAPPVPAELAAEPATPAERLAFASAARASLAAAEQAAAAAVAALGGGDDVRAYQVLHGAAQRLYALPTPAPAGGLAADAQAQNIANRTGAALAAYAAALEHGKDFLEERRPSLAAAAQEGWARAQRHAAAARQALDAWPPAAVPPR